VTSQPHGQQAPDLDGPEAAGPDGAGPSGPDTAAPDAAGEQGPQDTAAPAPGAGVDDRVAALTEDLQRVQAEYVNYKRRVDRDRDLVKQNATFSVLSALLPVLDDLDRAREHGELEGGLKAVADSLERIVSAAGLVKFGRPGDPFDPRLHEALMHGHAPGVTTTTCQNIVKAGYSFGERVVRPAQVTVVDPEPESAAQPDSQPDSRPDSQHDSPADGAAGSTEGSTSTA
jgi:molecular chaperone GrpE